MKKKSKKQKRKDLLVNLSLLVGTVIVCLLLLEIYLRFVNFNYNVPTSFDGHYIYLEDDQLKYKMKSNFEGRFVKYEFDTFYNTNPQGYRDYDFDTVTTDNIVFMLGDSMTVGNGVEEKQTYSKLLESVFPDWKFFNLAVAGYSQINHYPQIQRMIPKYKPKLVVLNFYMGNDIMENCEMIPRDLVNGRFRSQATGLKGQIRMLLRDIRVVNYIYTVYKNGVKKSSQKTVNDTTIINIFERDPKDEYMSECYDKTYDYIKDMKSFSDANGVKFLVALIPTPYQVHPERYSGEIDLYGQAYNILKFCEENDITCYDITKGVLEFKEEQGDGALLNYKKDGHPTSLGHVAFAQELAVFLRDELKG